MIRLLNILAIAALIGTAGWVYSIKYETIFFAEQQKKLENKLARERDAIQVLKAEWQHLNQPTRLQVFSDKFLDLKPLAATQIVRAAEIAEKPAKADSIGQKLDALITGSASATPVTPGSARAATKSGTTTPTSIGTKPAARSPLKRPAKAGDKNASNAAAKNAASNAPVKAASRTGGTVPAAATSPAKLPARPAPALPVPLKKD
jgi:hypothetical protein